METIAHYGTVDILVNNAGVANMEVPQEVPISAWQHVVELNLTGAFLSSQVAAREMIGAGHGGSIITIASILGAGVILYVDGGWTAW